MPDPIVITPAKLMHSVFCARTGYFVISKPAGWFDEHPEGEGDPNLFTIVEHKAGDIPEQYTAPDDDGRCSRIKKIDLHILATKKRLVRSLDNVVSLASAVFIDGDDDDFSQLSFQFDTMKNDVFHVGTGYAFATIGAAIIAANSGDAIPVHETAGNTYNETVNDAGKSLQIFGMVPNQGITITNGVAAGNTVTLTGAAILFENFTIIRPSIASSCVIINVADVAGRIARCCASGGLVGFYTTTSHLNGPLVFENNCAYDCSYGFILSDVSIALHCTAVDNTIEGFRGTNVTDFVGMACLASDNGTDFVQVSIRCAWNVSSDLTAPGAGSETGFTNDNFVNYAGNNFNLNYPQNATGAVIDGWPFSGEDHLMNLRSRTTLLFYAGYHDPYVAPGPQPPECCGAIDAAPAAQGCILVRFCEMECDDLTVPYRYDFHVKHVDLGPLTCAEINAGTWYARSCYNDEVNFAAGSPEWGSPGPNPAILEALIAFEAYNQHGDNVHLFTNREYQIAVRAVAIDATDTIYEDDNCEVVISWSSGYQGIQWEHILSWPCLEICDGQMVGINAVPDVDIATLPEVEVAPIDVQRMPNVPVSITAGINFRDSFADFGAKLDRFFTMMQAQRR